jgi:mannose-6-phosphate isomerase-like protein (cupin superfamily)
MLVDTRLTDEAYASARVFRVYKPLPAHYHSGCDEYLLVLTGRGLFFIGDGDPFEVGPGQLVFFKQAVVHGIQAILEQPLVFFSVDTPRRDPQDIHFVNPEEGTVDSFIQTR